MPHHFTKNTLETTRFCNTCKRNTQWYVWNGRLGRCKEDHHRDKPKKVEPEDLQQELLFEDKP